MRNCIMAIDGMLVRTRQPYKTEVVSIKSYRSRKGGFGIILMAGADVDGYSESFGFYQ